jgi:hypothetical protein
MYDLSDLLDTPTADDQFNDLQDENPEYAAILSESLIGVASKTGGRVFSRKRGIRRNAAAYADVDTDRQLSSTIDEHRLTAAINEQGETSCIHANILCKFRFAVNKMVLV